MAVDNPIGINDPAGEYTYDAATWRRSQSGFLVHDEDTLSARSGVLNGLGVYLFDGFVNIESGSAIVTPQTGQNGSYTVVLSSTETPDIDPSDATFDRMDRIVLRVEDPEIGGAVREGRVEAVRGTPSASPTPPGTPAGTLPLARVHIPAGSLQPDYVTDDRRFTAALGGVIPCTSTTRPSGSYLRPGQAILETNTGNFSVWTGSSWRVVSGQSDDTGWVNLESYLVSGFTGTLNARRWSGLVEFRIAVSGEYSGNSTDIATGIPSQFRPAWTKFGSGYNAGRVASMFVRSAGSVAVTLSGDGTVSSSAQGTILFSTD